MLYPRYLPIKEYVDIPDPSDLLFKGSVDILAVLY